MIIWVKKERTGFPNDQKAKIIRINPPNNTLDVEMLGGGESLTIEPKHICGVELEEGFSIRFNSINQWSSITWNSMSKTHTLEG